MATYLAIQRPHTPSDDRQLIDAARAALGLALEGAYEERRYLLSGSLDAGSARRIAEELLSDPLLSESLSYPLDHWEPTDPAADWALDIAYRPGVTDNEGESVLIGAQRADIAGLQHARTVRRVYLRGALNYDQVEQLAYELLANELVEAALVSRPDDTGAATAFYARLVEPPQPHAAQVQVIPLREADDGELERISRDGILALDLAEMRAIRDYYRSAGYDPTDGELETLAQTWSEHCSHKTFKALIEYRETGPDRDGPEIPAHIDGLLRTFFMAETRRIDPPWLLSAFVDNAGIVAFGESDAVSIKVETHNHPSALEPFGGANTGVGGVVRDVLGVSGQPIANLDVLCFGPRDLAHDVLPPGVLHPQRIADGVVAGVRDYGNKLGVPTVAGAVLYDQGYTRNPLVFCGTLGLARREQHSTGAQPGDAIVVVGGRTGRDGIHGATFSSEELTADTAETVGAAVQIGDPITEKKVIDVVLQARDQGLYRAITDCGAGGLSSAVGEMGERTGARVELAEVPLKYAGLQPWEIWLSEAQERMVLAVPASKLEAFLALCRAEDVEATHIGDFTDDRRLVVRYRGARLVDLEMGFLHDGRPQRRMRAVWEPYAAPVEEAPLPAGPDELRDALLALLAHPNIASREPIVRTYDHLVQGRTVQGPLGGTTGDAPTDAAIVQPRHGRREALALGCGINPRYGSIDPYWMALAACDEALRNVVSVGADPARTSLLDNFCWGDPREPDRLSGLVRAAAGCRDAARAWGTPFISGKDSLNNEYRDATGRRVAIPPTLLITALGVVPDIAGAVTAELPDAGDLVYLVGATRRELGGSHLLALRDELGAAVPRVELETARRTFHALHGAMRAGLVRACHDLSEGGLAVAAAELVLSSRWGLDLELRATPRAGDLDEAALLFSESPSRFLVAVRERDRERWEASMAGVPLGLLGRTTGSHELRVSGLDGDELLRLDAASLRRAFFGNRG